MAIAKHIGISKSRYTLYRQCPKALWLKTYKPEQAEISDSLRQRFESGSVVGDLAKGLFGNYSEVTAYTSDGKLDLDKMVKDITMEQAKAIAEVHEIEVDKKDTVKDIIAAVVEDFKEEEK